MNSNNITLLNIFFLIIILSCGSSVETESDWEKMNLKGKVKSITKRSYKITPDGKGPRNLRNDAYLIKSWEEMADYDIEFNKNGYKTKHSMYKAAIRPNDSIKWHYTYQYKNNQLVKEKHAYQDGRDYKEIKYQYDGSGRKVKVNSTTGTSSIGRNQWTYEYNGQGHLVKEIMYNADNEFKYLFDYENNTQGQKTKVNKSIYNRRNKKWLSRDWKEYKYNDQGQLVEFAEFLRDGRLSGRYNYTYDEYGNITQDAKSVTNNKGYTAGFSYEYDAQNNWVKCIVKRNNINTLMVEREIVYW